MQGCGLDGHSLPHQPEEALAAALGSPPVETECEFIQIAIEMLVADRDSGWGDRAGSGRAGGGVSAGGPANAGGCAGSRGSASSSACPCDHAIGPGA